MSKKLATEQQVKAALGISDWRNLSKEKVLNFVSILPDVDSEVAIKIIEQFPEFSKNSLMMVECLKDACQSVLEENKQSSNQSMEAYQKILDELSVLLKKENTTDVDIKYITEKMIEVADKISAKDTENKEFWSKVLNTLGGIVLGAVTIGAAVLGARFIGDNKS